MLSEGFKRGIGEIVRTYDDVETVDSDQEAGRCKKDCGRDGQRQMGRGRLCILKLLTQEERCGRHVQTQKALKPFLMVAPQDSL